MTQYPKPVVENKWQPDKCEMVQKATDIKQYKKATNIKWYKKLQTLNGTKSYTFH